MLSKNRVLISILILSLGIPPSWAVGKDAPPKPDSKDISQMVGAEKKLSPVIPVQVDWFASLATSMAAAATAILAIRSFPDNVKSSVKSFKDLKNFNTHRLAYLASKKDIENFTERQMRLLEDLAEDVADYMPLLEELDAHIRQGAEEPPHGADREKMKEIAEHIGKLRDLGGIEAQKSEIHTLVNGLKKRRSTEALEAWIDAHLNDVFKTSAGGEWLERYSRLKREYGVLKWLSKGSVNGIEAWIQTFQNRPVGKRDAFLNWSVKYLDLKEREKIAAGEFLEDFAEFTRRLNRDIKNNDAKFAVLLTLNKRQPGEFHSEEGRGPVPLYASGINAHAEDHCNKVLATLEKTRDTLGELGSRWSIPNQIMKVGTPLMTGLGAFGGGYLAIKGFFRLLSTDPTKPILPPGAIPGTTPGAPPGGVTTTIPGVHLGIPPSAKPADPVKLK